VPAMTDIFTATETTRVYKSPNGAGAYSASMKTGETAKVIKYINSTWLQGMTIKGGVTGYIERPHGFITQDKPTPPSSVGWLKNNLAYTGLSRIEQNEKAVGHLIFRSGGTLLNGLPDTERFYNTTRAPLYEPDGKTLSDFGKLSFDEFAKQAPVGMLVDEKLQAWKGVMKDGTAFTDFADGKAQNPIMTGNNWVYLAGAKTRTVNGNTSSVWWQPVRVLRIGKYATMKTQLDLYPLLAFNATVSTRSGEEPFGQLGGKDVKVLMFGYNDIDYLPADRIEITLYDLRSSYFRG